MDQNPRTGFVTMYKSVQGTKSIDDFVEMLLKLAKEKKLIKGKNLTSLTNNWNTFAEIFPEVLRVKMAKINHVWQHKLNYLIENVLDSNPNETLVIFLDEFSLMLNEMNPEEASTLIGFLRDIVHDKFPDRLRFVYTGSISIDLILDKIRLKGHNMGDPLNHTERERLQPFSESQTVFFCQCLELGCVIQLDDEIRLEIHKLTGGIPFFIDKIFDQIRFDEKFSLKSIDEALNKSINDPVDKNNLGYYYDRIKDHYPDPELSYLILLLVCRQSKMTENQIIDQVINLIDRKPQSIQVEIHRLWQDGYFTRMEQKAQRGYSFQYSIIHRWWKANKA